MKKVVVTLFHLPSKEKFSISFCPKTDAEITIQNALKNAENRKPSLPSNPNEYYILDQHATVLNRFSFQLTLMN